jgi:arylsulfatase
VPRVFFPNDKTGLALGETTIAGMLKETGYRTSCIGKWHLGTQPEYLPTNRGFDEYFGIPYSNDMTPRTLLENTTKVEEPATLETLTPRYTARAVRFIERAPDKPFFLYLPHTYPHIPLAASPRFAGKSPLGIYGDVIEEIDWSTGEIMAALKRTGVDDNTLVMFSSDNGPWYQGSPGALRGRKGSTYEGGVREPLLARFPGRFPKGLVTRGVCGTVDILPTFAKLTGARLPAAQLDGIDIWPLLTGAKVSLDRPEPLLYFDDWNLQCARWGKWKLHFSRYNTMAYNPAPVGGRVNLALPNPELYDLEDDPQESYDAAPRNPDVVKDIQARVERLLGTFPVEVRSAWQATQSRRTAATPVGALPRVEQ